MRNIVIGTAGHVDHGKTALIKALTGIDADRLKEEKKRGITIDLGFAYLDLPGGERAGIIDVPGHEKFIKNMLAGAGGIDLALLAVAADDGVMPQTREHLGILSLLDVRQGMVVITKADLADSEWLELVAADIRECVRGTFLEDADIHIVSAHTGQGVEELRQAIFAAVSGAESKNAALPFRLPVDRVFLVDGFGTVITGTLTEGFLSVGDRAELFPAKTPVRIRGLQVHSVDVAAAYAGQRVAVNVTGAKKEEIRRGCTVAAPGSMKSGRMLDVRLRCLNDAKREITSGSRLHFYYGAENLLCKAVLLDCDRLGPGEEAFAQLRFTEEVALKRGDRFVVRFYSPVETVGGGAVLDAHPQKHRRRDPKVLEALRLFETGTDAENILGAVAEGSPVFAALEDVKRRLKLDQETFAAEFEKLVKSGEVIRLSDAVAVTRGYAEDFGVALMRTLEAFHEANPLLPGMRRDELRARLLPKNNPALADRLIEHCAKTGAVKLDNRTAALPDFKIRYNEAEQAIADKIAAMFRSGGYSPPSAEDIANIDPRRQKDIQRVFEAMLAEGAVVMTEPKIYFHGGILEDAREKVFSRIKENGRITLAEMRDIGDTSRKYALSILEYFDRRGFTKKAGEARVLAKSNARII